jgi:hypothetical protein
MGGGDGDGPLCRWVDGARGNAGAADGSFPPSLSAVLFLLFHTDWQLGI